MKHLLLTLPFLFCALGALHAERRGIVIGNRDYADTGRFDDLATTLNDAALMHRLMTGAGFRMSPTVQNATRIGMEDELRRFCEELNPGDEAVVYYAGHGIQFENKVWLMGTNAEFRIKARLAEEAVSQEMLAAMLGECDVKLAVLILDCCREIPDQSWLATENRSRGLRGNEPPALVPPPNILIGYATSSGRLANDSLRKTDANGPLVLALQKHWEAGLEFDLLWKAVAREVLSASRSAEQGTAELQMPSKYGQTIHDFYFVAAAHNALPGAASTAPQAPLISSPPAQPMSPAPAAPAISLPVTAAAVPTVVRPRGAVPSRGYFSNEEMFEGGPYANYSPSGVKHVLEEAQNVMRNEGLYDKPVDGLSGKSTQEALFQYQQAHRIELTGKFDLTTLLTMNLLGREDRLPAGMQPVSAERVASLRGLEGVWGRQDHDYQIHVLKIYDNGQVKARYHNPDRGFIPVDSAYLLPASAGADFFMKLDRATYNGSEYTLRLGAQGSLVGQYLWSPDGERDLSHIAFDRLR